MPRHGLVRSVALALALGVVAEGAEIKVTPSSPTATSRASGALHRDSRESSRAAAYVHYREVRRPSNVWWDRTLGSETVAGKFDNPRASTR